ncbi:unnamed protein product [Rotaria sordida]|uniref:Uncharacterized protein n=1 Tax=Rotaria sordida TaxID=392033 RepID=A0A819N9Z9_9BILA|nr:unnamed protein product [Rotaria sordida]CAF3993707.1 unnamed protein product [Rotaria sordida]
MIVPQYQLFYTNYSIEWNGYHLSMISKLASSTTDILDQSQGNLLAQIQRRWLSWELNYRLDIFSDKVLIPESIYLLELAEMYRGRNG